MDSLVEDQEALKQAALDKFNPETGEQEMDDDPTDDAEESQ